MYMNNFHKNGLKDDVQKKEIENNVDVALQRVGDLRSDGCIHISMLATSGCIFLMVGLNNLCSVYLYGIEDDSLEWTLSSSVSMFGLMSILVAYCSYCAVFTRDLLVAILVLTMQNVMIIIQMMTACLLNQKGLTWNSIFGNLIASNHILKFCLGIVFLIHAFSWVFSYLLCDHLILETEQQPDHKVKVLKVAKWNKYANFGALIASLMTIILIETDIMHYIRNAKYQTEV